MAAITNNTASSLNMAAMLKSTQTAKAYKQNAAAADLQSDKAASTGNAYDVNISDAAKNAQKAGALEVSSAGMTEEAKTAGKATKGITAEELESLKAQTDQSYTMMIQAMTEQNMHIQNLFNEGIYDFRSDSGDLFSLSNFVLPPVGTTPEEAQAAISEGGDYSVEAVSDRIFNLASAIAGNDPEMLSQMRSAVEEGFRQAGVAFKDITGKDDMPQITHDTYDNIMSRFDARSKELSGE